MGYQGNKNGTLIYKMTEDGEYIIDSEGNKVIDEDISDVISEWDNYLKNKVVWENENSSNFVE